MNEKEKRTNNVNQFLVVTKIFYIITKYLGGVVAVVVVVIHIVWG